MPFARLTEERFFLTRQCEIETAGSEEGLRRGDRHDLQDILLPGPLNARIHEQFARPFSVEPAGNH